MAGPVGGSARPAAAQASVLDTLLGAAREVDAAIYMVTARHLRALGIGIDGATFERAAIMYADRAKDTAEAAANTYEEIVARGYFDLIVDGHLRLRIIVDGVTAED